MLTLRDLHFKWAVGYWLPSKAHMDGVRSFLQRFVGATEDVITLVFQNNFHGVVFILRVNNNHTNISSPSTWKWWDRILSSPSYRKGSSKTSLCVLLTCSVDVKISRLIGHIAHWLQTWTSSLNLFGITKSLCHIHHEGALINVLTSKEYFHLWYIRINKQPCHWKQTGLHAKMDTEPCSCTNAYLVEALNFGHIGDRECSFLVIVGDNLSLTKLKYEF